MQNFQKNVLFGVLEDGSVCFADIQLHQNSLSVHFDTVVPVTEEKAENLAMAIIELYSPETKMELLEQYDVPVSELAETVVFEEGVKSVLDCSTFNSTVGGYVFCSGASGERDFRSLTDGSGAKHHLVASYDKEASDEIMAIVDNAREKPHRIATGGLKSGLTDSEAAEFIELVDRLPEKYDVDAFNFLYEASISNFNLANGLAKDEPSR